MEKICAFSPATIANVNVGFDVLGLALKSVGDKVEVSFNNEPQNKIIEIVNGDGLPMQPEKNSCTVVIKKMQEALNTTQKVDVRIKKGFPSGSGLGSSSASSAAAAVAFNALMGYPFSSEELLPFAAEGERAACGTAHYDNVAPAVLGGIVLMQKGHAVRLPIPENLFAVSFFPKVKINTSDSRSITPKQIPLNVASQQVANMGAFVAALYQNNLPLLRNSLDDLLVEPSRKVLIPFFDEMRQDAKMNDALAFGISGSGPSVYALTEGESNAMKIAEAFQKLFQQSGIETQVLIESLSNNTGSYICDYNH